MLNSARILDIQRIVGAAAAGKKTGISRIHDRINAWLEEVFLAHEREMLRHWEEKVEKAGDIPEHRLSHDDLTPCLKTFGYSVRPVFAALAAGFGKVGVASPGERLSIANWRRAALFAAGAIMVVWP